jgi:plastocyanin
VTETSGPATSPDGPVSSAPVSAPSPARTGLLVAVAVVISVLAFMVGTIIVSSGETVTFVIPAGTGAAIDNGESIEVIPATISVSVGDTLRLVNDDTRPHVVGPWTVMPGTEFSFTFDEAANFSGACSAHPDRSVQIIAA